MEECGRPWAGQLGEEGRKHASVCARSHVCLCAHVCGVLLLCALLTCVFIHVCMCTRVLRVRVYTHMCVGT